MEKVISKNWLCRNSNVPHIFQPPNMVQKAGILPWIFLWAELSTRDIRTKKLKLVTSQPTVKRFLRRHNCFRFRDTEGQSRSISTFSTYAAPPSGTISKCGQVRRPYIEPLYQPTKFEKNRTRGSAISPIGRQPKWAKKTAKMRKTKTGKKNDFSEITYVITTVITPVISSH